MALQTTLINKNIDEVFYQFAALSSVSSTRLQTSLDGETWVSRVNAGALTYSAFAFGKNILVAVGNAVAAANQISTTGDITATFTQRTCSAPPASCSWQGIAFGNGIFVAIAGGAANNTIVTSTNTANWTLSTPAGLNSVDRRCIAFGDGKFVTLAWGGNTSRYSTDGLTWSSGSSIPVGNWKSIVYDPVMAKFVAVMNMPVRLVSGTSTFTSLQFTSGTNTLTRVSGSFITDGYISGQRIVISGTTSNNGTFTVGTVNALTMTVTSSLVNEGPLSTLATITPIDGAITSSDGITWTTGSPTNHLPSSLWNSIASNGLGRVMAVSTTLTNQLAAYSDDGVNWTSVTLPIATTWSCVAYGNNRWLILGQILGNAAFSDDNGVSWSLTPSIAFNWSDVKWLPMIAHANDTLVIDRGSTITVNTDQPAIWSGITITNGTLLIKNTSTSTAIRFPTIRTSGALVQAITPSSGLGVIRVEGDWIQVGIGNNTNNQTMTVPYTDYVSALWVETGVGTDVYEIWANVSGAYDGTLKTYVDGILDVSTGQRGKFFTQTKNSTQDSYITATATIQFGLFDVTLNSTVGIFQGASIVGQGIPANTVIEKIIDSTTVRINQLPVTPGAAYTATGYATIPVRIFNPYSSQFTNTVVFGNGVNGNKLTSGVKVRIPNIMITSDTPANLHTASALLGCSFVMTAGGRLIVDKCLMDEVYNNLNQTQELTFNNVGMHLSPVITEVYDLSIDGLCLAMSPTRRFNTANIWTSRDLRDTYQNRLAMSYVSYAVVNNLVLVCQAPHTINNGSATGTLAYTSMLNLSFSDYMTFSNVRMYALNAVRQYQTGIVLSNPVTNSTFTNIEYYGGPMLSSQFSANNKYTNLINSETMFSFSRNYTAGTRIAHNPNTDQDMVSGTKYYFKSRTYFTRDAADFTESREYSATPFKGSLNYPDYVTAYLNAPQSVVFGWTHRVPMYTAETSPLLNADAKNFLEIYRGTSPGFSKTLANKVAGLNVAPSMSIPTIVTWATPTRTLAFNSGAKTITASSGNFITDGYLIGDKVTVRGSDGGLNNKTFTITNVTSTVITVSETVVTQAAYNNNVSIVAKYVPTPKIILVAAGGRTLKFDSLNITASGGRTMTFSATNRTITASSGSFVTETFQIGDKVTVSSTTFNNTSLFQLTITAVTATVLTFTGDSIYDEVSTTANFKVQKLTASTGSFITDGYTIGDIIEVTGSANAGNNITFTVSNVTALYLNFIEATTTQAAESSGATLTVKIMPIPKVVYLPASSNRPIKFQNITVTANANRVFTFDGSAKTITASGSDARSFLADGFAIGDKVVVTNTALNNKFTLTLTAVTATVLTASSTTERQFNETSTTATLTVNKVITPFGTIKAFAAAGRTFTFAAAAGKTLTASSGNFGVDGFVVGDRVTITGTTSNNGTFRITVVATLVLTFATEDTIVNEGPLSSTAVAATDKVLATTGSLITEGFAIGDKLIVTGTTSGLNDQTFSIINVTAFIINVAETVITQTHYSSNVVVTASKLLTRQPIYGSAARTFTTAAAARTLSLSSGSMIQDGYIVGDKVLVNGMGADANHIYTISALSTTVLTWLDPPTNTVTTINTNPITWTHTGNRPSILGSVATQTWDAPNKFLTLGTGTWDTTYNFVVGDKILVTGQRYNNGLFTIAAISTNRITVTEPVIHDTTVYNGATNIILGYSNPQKRTITASAGRTLTFDNISKRVTASTGSFILDGYYIGDCVRIQNTAGALNDGYFTISALAATTMNFNELIYTQAAVSASVTISAPDIVDNTDYYYVVRKYDNTGFFNDSGEIYVKSTWQEPATNLALQSTAFSANKIATLHATAARTLTFAAAGKTITASSGSFTTDTYAVGDKIRVTRTASNNGYFTIVAVTATVITVLETVVNEGALSTSGAITNIFWDIMKVPLLTASAVRTLQFTTASSQAAGGRTMSFSGTTITMSTGSFITDGFVTGDKIFITGTSSNNGIYTITGTVNALTITTVETLVTESSNTVGLIRTRKIILAGTTPGSFVTDSYAVNDRITIAGSTSNNFTFTIMHVTATILYVYEAIVAEGPLNATVSLTNTAVSVGAATRISPFVAQTAAQTANAVLITSLIDNATLTQPISTAIGNAYTFSVWVATQPTLIKVPTITASAVRSFKFDGLSLTASGGRTLTWNSAKTITASSGSFHTDGYAVGDKLIVTGTTANNGTFTITTLTATVITVSETVVTESAYSANATIRVNKITAFGTNPGNFIENGFQIGDRIQIGGSGTPPAGSLYNIGFFTITNVLINTINVAETIFTEVTCTSVMTITDFFNDTFTVNGAITFGGNTQAFTATATWQEVSVTFTATTTLHNAIIRIDTQKRGICIFGAMVNTGSVSLPHLTTTTAPVTNSNKVRDISLVRSWCRALAEPESHSGIEIQLAAAITGELYTEIYCGTSPGFTPSNSNKILDTWAGSGQTIIFSNQSSNNVLDGFSQVGIGAAIGYNLVYFISGSLNNKIKNLTYNCDGSLSTGLASFNQQSNDQYFYNWTIKNWRNYSSTAANVPLFQTSNATSGLIIENLRINSSDIPIINSALNFVVKGMSGGNVKSLNSALLYNMPVTPVYTLGGAIASNFDSVGTGAVAANYTTVYDTIFNELYFTSTTGALHLLFNASSKAIKPYLITGNASFSNLGRLYFKNDGDSIEYTWPHKILGVSGFRNVPFLLNGVDLGNTPTLLEGLLIEFRIDTGSGYTSWAEATPASLSALTVSATDGFYFKIRITAKLGMKYSTVLKQFVPGETIRGQTSLATAVIDRDYYFPVQGTAWVSNVVGTFVPGETIVKDSNGEVRCINVATNTQFALFPSVTSYIDGLQIYTNVDQTAIYPPEQITLTLTDLKINSEVRIYLYNTTTELAGIENSGTSFEYKYTYSAGIYVNIVIHSLAYEYYRIDNYLLSATNTSLPIQQQIDRNYSNA